ncbi:hypothetical protein ABZ341_29760 [Streptomyces sp. NPDC006173]
MSVADEESSSGDEQPAEHDQAEDAGGEDTDSEESSAYEPL